MTSKDKALVTKERDLYTYAELWHASDCVLEKGVNEPLASSYQFLASIMLTAFSFEAYLNHAGAKTFKCWSELEKKLSIDAKLLLLSEKLASYLTKQRGLKKQ